MKGVAYVRVSTKEQEDGYSQDSQRRVGEVYAQNKDIELVRIWEVAESAKKEGRKAFKEMVQFLKDNDDVKIILFEKVDRATRNFADLTALYDLVEDYGKELHFFKQSLVMNKDSKSGDKLNLDIQVVLAKNYINNLSEEVRKGQLESLLQGKWPSHAHIGYKNIKHEDGSTDIVVDPATAPFVVKAFELYASGEYSYKRLRDKTEEMGLLNNWRSDKPLTTSQVEDMIKNPFYYGVMRWLSNLYPHNYPPLISKELFDKCQEVSSGWNKKPTKYGDKPFVFRGLISCKHCGCTITPEIKKGKYVYYHCTDYHRIHSEPVVWIPEAKLMAQVESLFKSIKIPSDTMEILVQGMMESFVAERDFYHDQVSALEKQYHDIDKKLEVAYEDRLSQRITVEQYDKLVLKEKPKQEVILNKIKLHTKADEKYLLTASLLLELVSRAYELFMSSEVHEKRQLLKMILQNCLLDGEKLVFIYANPFDKIIEGVKTENWRARHEFVRNTIRLAPPISGVETVWDVYTKRGAIPIDSDTIWAEYAFYQK